MSEITNINKYDLNNLVVSKPTETTKYNIALTSAEPFEVYEYPSDFPPCTAIRGSE